MRATFRLAYIQSHLNLENTTQQEISATTEHPEIITSLTPLILAHGLIDQRGKLLFVMPCLNLDLLIVKSYNRIARKITSSATKNLVELNSTRFNLTK